ncbi:MAG: hypothetical protein QXL33_07790 [Sulfolobaceae archaeon]
MLEKSEKKIKAEKKDNVGLILEELPEEYLMIEYPNEWRSLSKLRPKLILY